MLKKKKKMRVETHRDFVILQYLALKSEAGINNVERKKEAMYKMCLSILHATHPNNRVTYRGEFF